MEKANLSFHGDGCRLSLQKRIHPSDSLVWKFIVFNADTSTIAGITKEEEPSSIVLEYASNFSQPLDLAGDADTMWEAHDRHLELFFQQKDCFTVKKKHQMAAPFSSFRQS